MANSLRVLAYLPKRPFEPAGPSFRNQWEAEAFCANLKEHGWDAKVTRLKTGPRKKTVYVWNVWKREKSA